MKLLILAMVMLVGVSVASAEGTHQDSGIRCLAIHNDGEGQCILCSKCGQYIRPGGMDMPCPGKEEESKAVNLINATELNIISNLTYGGKCKDPANSYIIRNGDNMTEGCRNEN